MNKKEMEEKLKVIADNWKEAYKYHDNKVHIIKIPLKDRDFELLIDMCSSHTDYKGEGLMDVLYINTNGITSFDHPYKFVDGLIENTPFIKKYGYMDYGSEKTFYVNYSSDELQIKKEIKEFEEKILKEHSKGRNMRNEFARQLKKELEKKDIYAILARTAPYFPVICF